jgi:hypothetical protein
MSTNKLQQIRSAFQGLQTLYQIHLPKVDSPIRELKSNDTSMLSPFYIVEIRSEEGTTQDKMKNMIYETTGFLPSIYENGTRYFPSSKTTSSKSFSFET